MTSSSTTFSETVFIRDRNVINTDMLDSNLFTTAFFILLLSNSYKISASYKIS